MNFVQHSPSHTKKSPGRDEIELSLFQSTWNILKDHRLDLFSQMFVPGNLMEQYNVGLSCLPQKQGQPNRPTTAR